MAVSVRSVGRAPRPLAGVAVLFAVAPSLPGCASLIDPLDRQIVEARADDVLSVQGYRLSGDDAGAALTERWEDLADLMRRQPGFVSARLGRGTAGSSFWFAWSEWKSAQALRDAFSDDEVRRTEARMPDRLFGHLYAGVREVRPERR